jgi:hypothetical protein
VDDIYKVCGNCGHSTMVGGEYVCIDPAKSQQEVVPMGARRTCFVVTALTPAQLEAAALSPAESATIN